MSALRVAIVQQSCVADRERNLAMSVRSITEAASLGARLVLLQELHGLPYFCQVEQARYFDEAESIPGPTSDLLARTAADLKIVIVGSVFERRAPGLYHNTALVFDRDGRLAGRYRKMHIPDDPGFHEKYYFAPGDQGFVPIDTAVGRLGVLVCWDQWYPEAARLMALAGAELLLYPTAIGWDPRDEAAEKTRQLDSWQIIQRAHAVANGLPVLIANRIGLERSEGAPGIAFWGHSFIAGPQGELLAEAGDGPAVLIADIDQEASERVRRVWPFLRDRRIDAYGDLVRRFLA
ncbi:MAG: carbon-nitrogen hydrolase [Acidiferrobacteraceae bacterium]|jgi:N-carbamoylputrescine amidase